jgi:hypothetical protein
MQLRANKEKVNLQAIVEKEGIGARQHTSIVDFS